MFGLTPSEEFDKFVHLNVWWGARAIFRNGKLDFLHDRQGWYCFNDGVAVTPSDKLWSETADHRRTLSDWFNKKGHTLLINKIRQENILTKDNRLIAVEGEGCFRVEANPKASFGYLYLCMFQYE